MIWAEIAKSIGTVDGIRVEYYNKEWYIHSGRMWVTIPQDLAIDIISHLATKYLKLRGVNIGYDMLASIYTVIKGNTIVDRDYDYCEAIIKGVRTCLSH